jgi:hypothetical protein
MPQLAKLRFVNVGHSRARMDNLILNFLDQQGCPTDTTLLLRNGGGKSSILNLFFSLLRPDQREMFGGKIEGGERNLKDFIRADVPGVVIAEWVLDNDTHGSTERYLTGVFYEKRSTSSNERLRHLFFAAKSVTSEPRLTLEGLPIIVQSAGRVKCRTMTSFKQEWQEIGQQYIGAEVKETENQRDWQQILDAARIDPELFGYQLRMNRSEGGVAELFKFRESDSFVDFFLELVLDPALSKKQYWVLSRAVAPEERRIFA